MTLLVVWAVVAVLALFVLGFALSAGWGEFPDHYVVVLFVAAVLWPLSVPLFAGGLVGLAWRDVRRRVGRSHRRLR